MTTRRTFDRVARYEWLSEDPPWFHVRSHIAHYGTTVFAVSIIPIWVFFGVVPALAVVVAFFIGMDAGFDGGWNAAVDVAVKRGRKNTSPTGSGRAETESGRSGSASRDTGSEGAAR